MPALRRRLPVGADYEALLKDALENIPENTPQKEARLAAMVAAEAAGPVPVQVRELRWIGRKSR